MFRRLLPALGLLLSGALSSKHRTEWNCSGAILICGCTIRRQPIFTADFHLV